MRDQPLAHDGRVDTREASSPAAAVRIASERSRPSTTKPLAGALDAQPVDQARRARVVVERDAALARRGTPTARYIDPVST
jgi:hypothetical protein